MVQSAAANRDRDLPKLALRALGDRRSCPEHTSLIGDTSLVYRIGRNRSVACSNQAVLRSEMFGWIVKGRQRVGSIAVNRYELRRCCNDEHFLSVMDLEGGYEYELAHALLRAWPEFSRGVGRAGPLLDFREAWLNPRFRGKRLLQLCVRKVTTEIFSNYAFAVVRVPQTRDHAGPKDDKRHLAFKRYYFTFGARALPAATGWDGWMWAPHPDVCIPEPYAIPQS
jgi:hypothetical protein